jgi:hypothetical protein
MRKSFLIVIIGLLTLGMSMNSCTSENSVEEYKTDTRDQFVGTWDIEIEGVINYLEDGSIVDSEDQSETKTINVSKSGENDLLIGEAIYSIDGLFCYNTSTIAFTDGLEGSMTLTTVGTLSVDNFTLVSSVTGTWSVDGRNGTLSGSINATLTK